MRILRIGILPALSALVLLSAIGRAQPAAVPEPATRGQEGGGHPLLHAAFTNELGQTVRLNDFKGQALAITFFFTRCPIPQYCPRLSKNFEEASRKLLALPAAPTNWHFLSVTFDPDFDSPAVLKAYSERYPHDPAHWSFLTGAPGQIRELASLSDVQFDRDGPLFNHNFRTLVIDARGRLQMSFPVGGDLSQALVEQVLKAAAGTKEE
ncbi:MAG TPA: SCO family protein [Verrucomicrobiae bacterium]